MDTRNLKPKSDALAEIRGGSLACTLFPYSSLPWFPI
jgi:hypothetical protein